MQTTKTLGKLALLLAVMAILFSCEKSNPNVDPTPVDTIPVDGLIAYWPLDSCTYTNDVTGNGHNGMPYNTSLTTDRFGNVKSAFAFNGINSYISVEDKEDLRLNNTSYTLSAWVKLEGYNTSWGSNILTKHNGVPVGWGISINGQLSTPLGAVFVGSGGGAINAYGTKVVALSSWHMVACTYNYATQQVSIYVDGVLDNVTNGVLPGNAPTNKLYIGRDDPAQPTNGYFLQGALDDIRIYNKCLTEGQVLALYNQTAVVPGQEKILGPTAGLIAYWPLSICAGTSDLSGLGHTGTGYNISYTKDRFGNDNGAAYFNGVNSQISVDDQEDIRLTDSSFTLNAWVKLDSYNTSWGSTLLIKHNALSPVPIGYGFSVEGQLYNPAGATYFGAGGGAVNAQGTKIVSLSQWHMISTAYNVTTQQLSIYVDGVLDNVTDGILPIKATTNKLFIGSDDPSSGSSGYFVKGAMEDISIYNRTLSATEIQQLYTAVK